MATVTELLREALDRADPMIMAFTGRLPLSRELWMRLPRTLAEGLAEVGEWNFERNVLMVPEGVVVAIVEASPHMKEICKPRNDAVVFGEPPKADASIFGEVRIPMEVKVEKPFDLLPGDKVKQGEMWYEIAPDAEIGDNGKCYTVRGFRAVDGGPFDYEHTGYFYKDNEVITRYRPKWDGQSCVDCGGHVGMEKLRDGTRHPVCNPCQKGAVSA